MSAPQTPRPGIAQALLDDRTALPGLLPQEICIFKAWWKDNKASFTGAEFNVRVGTGYDPGEQYLKAVRESTIANSQKRLDALLWQAIQPTIVEVKFRATPLVIGQILCYSLLWTRMFPDNPKPSLYVLCAQTDTDTAYCCQAFGIVLFVVAADFTGIKVQKRS